MNSKNIRKNQIKLKFIKQKSTHLKSYSSLPSSALTKFTFFTSSERNAHETPNKNIASKTIKLNLLIFDII